MGVINWNPAEGGSPIKISDTAPSLAAADSILIKKDGGELREATFTEFQASAVGAGVVVKEVTFTEAAGGAGQTYTGSVNVPAGAWLLDVIIAGVALWDDTGAVSMQVGTSTPSDPNGFFTATNLKATDLLAGEYLSAYDDGAWGGLNGAYLTTAGVRFHYSATARVVTATITTANGDGSAGRTRMLVAYAEPAATTAATQAAT